MRTLLLASLPPILAMSVAFGAKAAEKTLVILGTATPGGGFPVYGQAVSESINAVDTTLDVRPQNTAGSSAAIARPSRQPKRSRPRRRAARPALARANCCSSTRKAQL